MYDIPWPPQFMAFISTLRVFLIDVVSITKANCARPMNYYDSMMLVLMGTKAVLVLLLLGPWLWGRLRRSRFGLARHLTERGVRKGVSAIEDSMAGRRRASVARYIQSSLGSIQRDALAIDWTKVFRTSFMILFVSYPGMATASGAKQATSVTTVTCGRGDLPCLLQECRSRSCDCSGVRRSRERSGWQPTCGCSATPASGSGESCRSAPR